MPAPRGHRGRAAPWVLLALGSLGRGVGATKHIGVTSIAVITVHSPESSRAEYAGYFATFSAYPPDKELAAWVPGGDPYGCSKYPEPPGLGGHRAVAVIRRGNCTFLRKAQLAQQSGAAGVVIVSDSNAVMVMQAGNTTEEEDLAKEVDIFVVDVAKDIGDNISAASMGSAGNGTSAVPVLMSFKVYAPSIVTLSSAVIVIMGTALVAAGAFFSTSDLKVGGFSTAIAPPQEEVMEVDSYVAIGFCAAGSAFLMILYFFMHYMIYFIIVAFCLGGASCISQFGALCLQYFVPRWKQRAVDIPMVGPFTIAELVAGIPAIMIVACWVVLRNTDYGWPFQDVIGAGFLCWLQRTLRLPNIRIATLLLCMMFCFDIFWVFISPLIFHHSVMVTVAKGGGTHESVPMLLRVPSTGGGYRLLGFGDIALPGLLVSYLRRHDMLSRRGLFNGYFAPSLVGYFVGLCTTLVALMIMRMGQPALLYLVPGTLGTTICLALCRGELACLWDGRPVTGEDRGGCCGCCDNDAEGSDSDKDSHSGSA